MFVGKYNMSNDMSIDISNNMLNSIYKKTWTTNNKLYTIMKYNKSMLTRENIATMGLYRSVIMSNNNINVFSPPKGLAFNEFIQYYPEHECIAEEFVEGTMINLFYDTDMAKWEIASKSTVGCSVTFNKEQPTFRELFYDICTDLSINFDVFSKDCCYSFIIQHPKNKFVTPIIAKKLYLISIYKIDNENKIVQELPRESFSQNISLPNWFTFNSYKDIYSYYTSTNLDASIMGIVIRHKDGVRTKIRNPSYEYIKHLRGNHCKLQYQYLSLRKLNRVKEYLMYFPEKKADFYKYRLQLHNYTETLYLNYINCYIKKEKPLKEYSHQFKLHMYELHRYYLSIRNDNGYINKNIVINYVNNLQPAQIMYVLNYHLREVSKAHIMDTST